MKKILKIVFIISIITLITFKLEAKVNTFENYKYKEDYHSIKFDNLNSKNINELFEGINGTIIEIEVETTLFTKSYRFNTSMIDNVEKNLTEKVIKDLEELGKRELATNYKVNGIKITRMDIRCTKEELRIINSRIK